MQNVCNKVTTGAGIGCVVSSFFARHEAPMNNMISILLCTGVGAVVGFGLAVAQAFVNLLLSLRQPVREIMGFLRG